MPTGVLHLKEVDTDEITLDGTLSVSGASTLEGATVTHNTLSVGGAATLADANATNVNVSGTLSVAGQTTMGGDIIPDTNDAYDIGSPEFKIRDLYVSNNSIWVGDDMKISNVNGSLKFRKRKTDVVPKAILDAGANAGHANEQATADAALAHAGIGDIGSMKLQHWFKFMRTLNAAAQLTDIFRDDNDDYEESSASDAWKEIADTNKIYTNSAVGVGTSDPDDTLHVKGSFKVESETGFKLIRSSVGGTDPTVIIDTQNFGTDETVNDLTGRGDAKYTKLYRVYGRNSEGVGRSWYWGYANDDYSNFSLAFDGGGLPDPDIAFTFTTASELHCNKVYAALGGNADTATKLATPRKINGIDFDGTADITIPTGSGSVDGITSVNGKIGVGNGVASPQAFFHVSDRTVDSLNGVGNGKARFMMNVNAPGLEYHGNEYGMEIGVHGSGNSSLQSIVYDHSATTVTAAYNLLLQPFGGNVGFGTDSPSARVTVAHDMVGTDNTIPASNMGENAEFPKGTHLWLANKHGTTKPYWGLAIGTTWQGSSYIQNLNKKTSAYYNLLLQPNGGFLGVGTNNPETKFSVVGNFWSNDTGGDVLISNSSSVGSSITFNATASAISSPRWSIVANGPGGGAADGNIGFFDHNAMDYPVVIYKGSGLVNPNPQATTTNNIKLRVKGSILMPSDADGIIIGGNKSTVLKDENLSFGWGGGWYMSDANYIRSVGNKALHFGSSVQQHINLWGTEYGIGVQSYTQYFRSAGNFTWYRGGSHNSTKGHGGGGTKVMSFDDDGWSRSYQNFFIGGSITGNGADFTTVRMRSAGDTYRWEPGNDGWLRLKGASGGQGNMHGDYTSLAVGRFHAAGYDRYSDDRIKHFEEPIVNSLNTIEKIKPVKYKRSQKAYAEDFKGDIGEEGKDWDWELGVIAQEMLQIDELKFVVKDENDGPEKGLYGVDYNHFIALLIQGVKDLKQVVDDKDVEIENLKKELNDEKLRINDIISRLESLESN